MNSKLQTNLVDKRVMFHTWKIDGSHDVEIPIDNGGAQAEEHLLATESAERTSGRHLSRHFGVVSACWLENGNPVAYVRITSSISLDTKIRTKSQNRSDFERFDLVNLLYKVELKYLKVM